MRGHAFLPAFFVVTSYSLQDKPSGLHDIVCLLISHLSQHLQMISGRRGRRWWYVWKSWHESRERVSCRNGALTAHASPCLWNHLRQHADHQDLSLSSDHISSSFPSLPLSLSISPSLCHSRLKTHLFHKSLSPWCFYLSTNRTDWLHALQLFFLLSRAHRFIFGTMC